MLIVEDGTGKSDSESYISVGDADQYLGDRGVTAWAALTTEQKEQKLRLGCDYLENVYGLRWKGTRASTTQALSWPRTGVYVGDELLPSNIVPTPVSWANAELAVRAISGPLMADQGRATTREKVGEIEVEYSAYASQTVSYPSIDAMLALLIEDGGSGYFRRVVRT